MVGACFSFPGFILKPYLALSYKGKKKVPHSSAGLGGFKVFRCPVLSAAILYEKRPYLLLAVNND